MNKLSTLSEEYQGKDGQSNLIAQSKLLSNSYKELKKSSDDKRLEDSIEQYDSLIEKFSTKYHEFYREYLSEKTEEKKNIAYAYVENTQIHLTKLQSQYNQLVYRKQQCDNNHSMLIARVALGVTIFFSILSLIFSFFDIKHGKVDSEDKIEQLSDSINKLNREIDQQHEFILNHSHSLPENTDFSGEEVGEIGQTNKQ